MLRRYFVVCDRCHEPGPGRGHTSGADARRAAKKRGWLRIPKRSGMAGGSPGADYCPRCVKAGNDAAEGVSTVD